VERIDQRPLRRLRRAGADLMNPFRP
jgi:hypothetical protein